MLHVSKSDKCSWTVLHWPAISCSAGALNSGYSGRTIGQVYFAGCGPFAKFPFSWELRVPGGSVQGEAVDLHVQTCNLSIPTLGYILWCMYSIYYFICNVLCLYLYLYVLYTGMGTLANGVVTYILGYQIPTAVFVSGLSEHVALIGPEE